MYIPVYICKFIMFYDVENAGACQSICVIHLIKAIIETFINGSKNNEKQEKKLKQLQRNADIKHHVAHAFTFVVATQNYSKHLNSTVKNV